MVGFLLATAFQLDVPGFAEITTPAPQQTVHGIVSIIGTANHPAFVAYELGFSFDPDPTDTWFAIGEPIDTPVLDGRLGIWDTVGISDGNYRLRLTVRLNSAEPLVAIVDNVRIRNYTATETPSAPPTVQPTIEPTVTQVPSSAASDSDEQGQGSSRFVSSLTIGVMGALSAMLALAVYLQLSPRIRSYAAHLRMRQLHRRQDRTRSKSSPRD